MRVELLTVPGCPNRSTALARVREALDRVDEDPVVVSERVIDDPAVAFGAGMRGSPTILVDGLDPFVADDTAGSVSCRLYRSDVGIAGAPTVGELVEALRQRRRGR